MRVPRPIVEAATDLLAIGVADLLRRRRMSAKPVGDDRPRSAELLHHALEKLPRRGLVRLRSDLRLQDLAFMVDCAPEIAELAVDLHKHLVQMPSPLRIATHLRHPLLSDLSGEHRTKPVPPKPDRLMADVESRARPADPRRCATTAGIITTSRMTSGELLKYRNGFLIAWSYHGERHRISSDNAPATVHGEVCAQDNDRSVDTRICHADPIERIFLFNACCLNVGHRENIGL